jgi:polyhydroxyalkanoate synthesis regulator phasin
MGFKEMFKKKKDGGGFFLDLTKFSDKEEKSENKDVNINLSENEGTEFLGDFASAASENNIVVEHSFDPARDNNSSENRYDSVRILRRKIIDLEERIELLERKISRLENKDVKNEKIETY